MPADTAGFSIPLASEVQQMDCHYFRSARSGRRLLFRENEYSLHGFVLRTQEGGVYHVTSRTPELVVIVDEPKVRLAA